MTTNESDSDETVRLDGAQARLREAFFTHESGLFVLESDPGAGKSTTSEHIAAEYLARLDATRVVAPEESMAFVSFTRDDAAAIGPGIADALTALATDPEREFDLDRRDAEALGRRVQRASHVGTVDSVLGEVFSTIARDVGYSEEPSVGERASLRRVHAACLGRLSDDDTLTERFERLNAAYPGGEHNDDASALLRTAHRACRERQLTAGEFQTHLESVFEGTYPDGPPDAPEEVLADVASFVDDATADQYASRIEDAAEDVVTADQDLYDAWQTAVSDLCVLLEAYTTHYDDIARGRGIASYLDVAHWVTRFFTQDEYAGAFRDRLRARYTEGFDVVVVDEAQDVSVVQHAALSELVDEHTRVLLVGDRKQGVFQWRNAHPQLLQEAIDDGAYFGVEWETHVVEHEPRTRRCRPGVASAIDSIYADVFTDPARGHDTTVVNDYTPLEPTRAETDDPSVHIAPVTTTADPGGKPYISATEGMGEARALAHCIANGLDTGAFSDPDTAREQPSMSVLVPARRKLDAYKRAFREVGLSVGDATTRLYDHPLVEVVVAVTSWLTTPDEATATRTLAADSAFEDTNVPSVLELYDYSTQRVAEVDDDRPAFAFVRGLTRLRTHAHRIETRSVEYLVERVIDELDLYADPLDVTSAPATRVTALDRLLASITDRVDSDTSLSALAPQLEQFRDTPENGPDLPVTHDCDVVIKTIYQMKGDEDDVVALANIGQHVSVYGAHRDAFTAHGPHLALAPPPLDTAADTPPLPGFDHGLFTADTGRDEYDAGLRWLTHQWASPEDLAGATPLRALAAAERAERWRVLYVALSRARNHLVIPLPQRQTDRDARDHWIETIREALQYDGTTTETYDCDAPTGAFSIRTHDPTATSTDAADDTPFGPSLPTTTDTTTREWTPRFASPSLLHPLQTNPETHILAYLQRRSLHSDHDGLSDDIPLTFETMGPDDVGDIAHAVLATAIRNDVETDTLRSCTGPVNARLRAVLGDHAATISARERDQLEAYIRDTICPQFAASTTWRRVKAADAVYVEEPLEALVRVAGLDIELQGTADIVLEAQPGHWHVEELKLTLQSLDEDTRTRYRLQTQAYAHILAEQRTDDVTAGITQLGVEPTTTQVPTEPIDLTELRQLL